MGFYRLFCPENPGESGGMPDCSEGRDIPAAKKKENAGAVSWPRIVSWNGTVIYIGGMPMPPMPPPIPPPMAAISSGEGPAYLDAAMTSSIRRIMTAASAALETA